MSCKHYNRKLEEKDRHYIENESCNNCILCLVEKKGPMTQGEIAEYFGVSKMRINQIEKKALQKIDKVLKDEYGFLTIGDLL